jgi:hypothetical protein
MSLPNTVVVPPGNPAATNLFNLELKTFAIFFCVLGAENQRLATFADKMASNGDDESPWQVVWVQDATDVLPILQKFPKRVASLADPAKGIGVTLSFDQNAAAAAPALRTIADVIKNDPAVIGDDNLLRARVFKAFIAAASVEE